MWRKKERKKEGSWDERKEKVETKERNWGARKKMGGKKVETKERKKEVETKKERKKKEMKLRRKKVRLETKEGVGTNRRWAERTSTHVLFSIWGWDGKIKKHSLIHTRTNTHTHTHTHTGLSGYLGGFCIERKKMHTHTHTCTHTHPYTHTHTHTHRFWLVSRRVSFGQKLFHLFRILTN